MKRLSYRKNALLIVRAIPLKLLRNGQSTTVGVIISNVSGGKQDMPEIVALIKTVFFSDIEISTPNMAPKNGKHRIFL